MPARAREQGLAFVRPMLYCWRHRGFGAQPIRVPKDQRDRRVGPRGGTMLFALRLAGAIGLCTGGLAMAIAHFLPARRAKLQELGSGLLVGSLVLLGFSFSTI